MPPLFILNSNVPENSAANAAKIIVLIVTAASKTLVFDTALVVKLVHVVKALTNSWNYFEAEPLAAHLLDCSTYLDH